MVLEKSKYIYGLIFLSGLAALSWEVVWQIKSSLALGASSWGTAITLAVVMGGMAIGALLTGTILRKKEKIMPVKLYGILEIVIGLSGLSLVYSFGIIEQVDTWMYSIKPEYAAFVYILGIVSILGLPAICLGATIPVIGLISQKTHTSLSTLYGLNTIGAALGCLFAAFIFIPFLGVQNTIYMIAATNIIIGIIAISLDKSPIPIPKSSGVVEKSSAVSFSFPTAMYIVFLTGFCTFLLEVAWFRSLTSAFLSTTDAFAIMLCAVLLALGIGSELVTILRAKNIALSLVIAIAGILVFCSTPLIERFDYVTHGADESPMNLLSLWFSMTLYCVGLPILFLGVALPWLLDEQTTPRKWGILYSLNAIAAILGAVIATWILLPTIGFAKTAWLAGFLLIAMALFLSTTSKMRWRISIAGIIVALLAFTFESGVGRTRVQGYFYKTLGNTPERILAFDEGPNATVSVVEYDDGLRLLAINGFVTTADENKSKGDSYHYMPWMGHLPMLLHPDPKSALVICFGTGQTVNAVRKENPETLDIVDINEQVYEFAPHFISNENVLEDPRVNPIVMDGRAYVRRTEKIYDVITLEPMPPSFAGVNALYSKEFYEEARDSMSEDGIIAQWVPFHIIPVEASTSISRTMQSVFPNSVLWIDPLSTTGILIGSKNPDRDLTQELPGYARLNIDRTLNAEQVREAFVFNPEKLMEYGALGSIINDNNQLLAYGKLLFAAHNTTYLDEDNQTLIKEISED